MLTSVYSGTFDAVPYAQFALDTMVKIMPIYEQMFDIEFPLPKLDLFGVRLSSCSNPAADYTHYAHRRMTSTLVCLCSGPSHV